MLGLLCLAGIAGPARAQSDAASNPPNATPSELKLPSVNELKLSVPRPVKAATAALGMGRQRLALVIGVGTVGQRLVLDTAPRDAQAVAALLRDSGYVVMLREDLGSSDLRANLKEFHDRLQPDGVGFVYLTGLGLQLDGKNLLLPRDAVLDPALPPEARIAQWRSAGVPLSEAVDALMGPADSPRLLVVDAAYNHPALAALAVPGLAAQRLPPGMMALFGLGLGAQQEVPAAAALPSPPPSDPGQIAASPFARALVTALGAPRVKGSDGLRATRKALFDRSLGQIDPWLGGDTDTSDEFAEADLLDGLVPRTPEEIAREGVKQLARNLARPAARAGEQSVTEVLQQAAAQQPAATPPSAARTTQPDLGKTETMRPSSASNAATEGKSSLPNSARAPQLPSASSASNALSTAASTAGTAASVAGTVEATAAAVKVAETAAAVSAATSVLSAASSLAGQAMALVSRAGSGAAAEAPAGEAVQQLAVTAKAAAPATLDGAAAPAVVSAATPGVVSAATPAVANAAAPAEVAAAVPAVVSAALPAASPAAALQLASAANGLAAAGDPAPLPAAPTAPTPPAARAVAPGQPAAVDGRTMRNGESGERPVYTPRSNSFGYSEGDTFTYQVIDSWKDELTGSFTTAIEEVLDNGKLLGNGHQLQMDPQGRVTRETHRDGSYSEFEPSQDLWWSNPKRGESRDLQFKENLRRADGSSRGEVEWKGSTRVGKPRKIELPAGEFEVLPIESSGWLYESLADGTRNSAKWSRIVWYSPRLGHPVAIDIEDTDRLGKLLKRERVELLHAQSARNAP